MSTFGDTALAVTETPTPEYAKPRLLARVREAIFAALAWIIRER